MADLCRHIAHSIEPKGACQHIEHGLLGIVYDLAMAAKDKGVQESSPAELLPFHMLVLMLEQMGLESAKFEGRFSYRKVEPISSNEEKEVYKALKDLSEKMVTGFRFLKAILDMNICKSRDKILPDLLFFFYCGIDRAITKKGGYDAFLTLSPALQLYHLGKTGIKKTGSIWKRTRNKKIQSKPSCLFRLNLKKGF